MTFHEMVFKNLKAHARKYITFFLCNIFSIMVLFMYFTLIMNRQINKNLSYNTKDMFMACTIAIIVFIFGFLNYAYWTFAKGRKNEFGLFQILGMTSKDLKNLILLENGIIILLSLTIGLISGRLFSRLFFLAAVRILKKEFIQFSVGFNEYGATILVFLAIFILMNVMGNHVIKKMDLIELVKFNRKGEKGLIRSPLILLLGILMVFSAYFLKYASMTGMVQIREVSTKFVLLLFPGLYLLMAQVGNALIGFLERRKKFYYRNILHLAEFKHKLFRSLTAVYLLSILSALTMFFLGDSYTRYLFGFRTGHYESPEIQLSAQAVNNLHYEEGLFLLFISCFLAVLFLFSAGCMINFKLFNEIDQEKIRYQKLFRVGVTVKEISRYLSIELKLFFSIPMLIGILVVYPFIILENFHGNRYQMILGQVSIIILLYAILQTGFYFMTKRSYIHRVVHE